jgi:type II secretory pathway pseudopilin PulG
MMPTNRSYTRHGAALLEVMVSVVLIATAGTATLTALRLCTAAQSRSEKRVAAMLLAERQLAVLRLAPIETTTDETPAKFPPPGDAYAWVARVLPPTEEIPFRQVRLTIQSTVRPPQVLYTMWSLLP